MNQNNQEIDEVILSLKIPENLRQSIKSIATKQNYINYEVAIKKLSTDGGSFMGILYEIDIKGTTADGDKEINIFVKHIVENLDMPIYSIPEVFRTESWVYTELSKIFEKLQDEAKISSKDRLHLPYSFDECNPKSIILEHLGKKGFKLYDRMESVSLEYAVMCIKELAKFHALTFVIEEKMPEYFKEKIATKMQPYNFDEHWYAFVENMSKYSISCLEPEVKERVKENILKKVNDYPKYMTDERTVRTLCHGDYKLNNIMAKEINGEITEVAVIDFQILHYGCPILDFIYFIFHGTDQEFKKKNLTYLKDLYYKNMEDFLNKFGINIEKYFPKTEFEEMYKEKLDFGLMINTFYAPFLFAAEDNAPDVTTAELSTLDFKVDSRFTERYRGIVDDFIQWGYI